MLTMPKQGEYHALGWALDHVMSAPNVRAKSQTEIAEFATLGGYHSNRRQVGNYMRNYPETDKQGRGGQPRSRPQFAFVWALIRGAKLTQQQATELTDAWLEIQPEDERESLRQLCAIVNSDNTPSEVWDDLIRLESHIQVSEEGEHVRGSGDSSGR